MGPEPFEYAMAHTLLGLVFTDYTYATALSNPYVETLISAAAHEITSRVVGNPGIQNQALTKSFTVQNREYDIFLHVVPKKPEMTWGNMVELIPVLQEWVREYESVECDFQIWALPGTDQATRLGTGHIVRSA